MEMETSTRIRLKLESFSHQLLISSCKKMIDILQNTSLNSIGMITLPTRKRIYCVLRSPHVDKDSREHFEIRVHKRVLEIYCDSYDFREEILDLLSKADLPPGTSYHIL